MKYATRVPVCRILLLVLAFATAADTLATTHPVHAAIAGLEVSTRVDSLVASQLLNDTAPAAV